MVIEFGTLSDPPSPDLLRIGASSGRPVPGITQMV